MRSCTCLERRASLICEYAKNEAVTMKTVPIAELTALTASHKSPMSAVQHFVEPLGRWRRRPPADEASGCSDSLARPSSQRDMRTPPFPRARWTSTSGEEQGDLAPELRLYQVRQRAGTRWNTGVGRGWPLHLARLWHEPQPPTASHDGGCANRPGSRMPRCAPHRPQPRCQCRRPSTALREAGLSCR